LPVYQSPGLDRFYAFCCWFYRFQTDFIVCGIAPFKDMLLLLAYMVDDIDEIAHIGASEGSESKVCDRMLIFSIGF
jgi:hypothetical protein